MSEEATGEATDGPVMPARMPRPRPETTAWFRTVVPDDPGVTLRPMFGNLAAFANGNLFAGLYGEDVYVRLPEEGRAEVQRAGGTPFAPMDRVMREYAVVPGAWREDPGRMREWIGRALETVAGTAPRERNPRRTRRRNQG